MTGAMGRARLHGGIWHIDAEPHVAMMLKRWFHKSDKGIPGHLRLTATPEVCRDLEWFSQRYPLDFAPLEALKAGADQHRDTVLRLEEYFRPDFHPRTFAQMAIQPRAYQVRSAEVCRAQGGLLCADELGLGKAQPLGSKVLTPSGWRLMGNLVIGDEVIDPDGGVGRVTGVYPQGEREIFRVTMKDGASAERCDEHLWPVQSNNDRSRGIDFRVLPLRAFRDNLQGKPSKLGWRLSKWFLPLPKPVSFAPVSELPIAPYLLGVLIGDGSFCQTHGSITMMNPDAELIDRARLLLPAGVELLPTRDRHTWRYTRAATHGPNPLTDRLRVLNLWGKQSFEKAIPPEYLKASVEERLELLRGLMDTDGDCSKEGTSIFNTSSPLLRDAVVELARSLGGIASLSIKQAPKYRYNGEDRIGRTAYRVNLRLPICPFHLSRKAERWRHPIMARAIAKVEPSRRAEARCISVSTKRQLYITDGHLVTHNTCTAITLLSNPDCRPAVVVPPVHLQRQWASEILKFCPMLTVHIAQKSQPYPLPEFFGNGPDIVIVPYSKLAGWGQVLAEYVRTIVFDEAHELRRKGTSAQPSKRYAAAAHIAKRAKFRLGLSATPIFNYGGEIYNVLDCLTPGKLGSRREFHLEWCKPGPGGNQLIKNPRAFGSWSRSAGIIIRHTRKEVGRELPPVITTVQTVDADAAELDRLEGDAATLARVILRDTQETRGEKMQAAEELANKLRQAIGIAKSPWVADFVRMLVEETGEQVLLAGWHRAVYGIWAAKLAGIPFCYYTGTESPSQKEESKRKFLAGEAKVMFISLRSGAGLDGLQDACKVVVIGELDWSPKVHDQLIGRLHRDGQDEPVLAYYLVAETGADPVIARVLGLKKQQAAGIEDPTGALVENLESDSERIKKLAQDYLRRHASAGRAAA